MQKFKNNFCHIHLHSTYSYVDGFGLPKQYIERCKEIGQTSIAVTDHGNISAHYKWYKTANKYGIKPILGCELYTTPENGDNRNYNHITVLALNNEGYKNLLKIVTESWKNIHYRKPLVDMNFVIQHQKGLMITSGCVSGKICQFIINGQIEKAKIELINYKNSIEHFYIEIMPWTFSPAKDIIEKLYNISKELNIPMVATMDCHYVKKEQSELQEILLCIQSNDTMANPNRWKFDQTDFYLKTREEMEQSFKNIVPHLDFTEALDNTVKIAEMVDFEFPKASPLKFPIPDKEKQELFYQMCTEGMKDRALTGKEEYEKRMKYEYKLIVDKDFIDYFLIVADLVQWTKKNNILVGPARGSAAGSLICYLLKITEVDPIKYGLMFERFIDINREDLPDIDIDFEDDKRELVINYLKEKYGTDKISAIATFSTFKGKNIIQDFGRVFRIPFDVINKLKSIVIERSGGDSRASLTVQDSFEQFDIAKEYIKQYPCLKLAPMLEGQLRNMSSHASGIIINNESLINFCAMYQVNEEFVTSVDYYDASELGLVKIDILGLNTLTCVQKALKMIKERTGKVINIYEITFDDKKVYQGFQDPKKLFGIFQFDGTAVNQVCRQMKPENFEELNAANALSRPGPMHGLDLEYNQPITSIYIARKWKQIPKKFAHPLLKSITDNTQGVIIYQEQVMKVMREIGKMSWKDTAEIRKNISKSRGIEAFNEYKAKFAIGAKENGLTDFEINNIWSAVCSHGSWSFNLSHSVSYSMIAYWTMFLKIYYPIEYYVAMVSTMHNEGKIKRIIKEYLREEFELLPIDINKSKASFIIDNDKIRIGIEQIKGIGKSVSEKITNNQPYYDIDDFEKRSKAGKKATELLAKMGAFKSIGGTTKYINTLFGIEKQIKYIETINLDEKLKICPLSVDFNIFEQWSDFISEYIKFPVDKIENVNPEINSQVIIGIVYDKNLKDKIEEAITRGKPAPPIEDGLSKFCNFTLEDNTDFYTIRVSPKNFPAFGKLIFEEMSEGDIIMVKGRAGDGIRLFFANEIISLTSLKGKIDNNENNFTDSELVMMGKLWRNLKKSYN